MDGRMTTALDLGEPCPRCNTDDRPDYQKSFVKVT